jgi:glycosyltransferase involved in cell wall biosynthesis
MTSPAISVVIPAHNPDGSRLRQTLRALQRQSLLPDALETLLVDNASTAFPPRSEYADVAPPNLRLIVEPRLGLTTARLAGIRAANGSIIVLVDDDNVLDPNYLAEVIRIFSLDARLAAAGGKSLPVFESSPASWQREFLSLLALRDLGDAELVARSFRPHGAKHNEYPAFAPVGAGMALRREAALAWADAVEHDPRRGGLDRSGDELVSGGDNDIVMTVLEQGWAVGYFPSLSLGHLIPAARLDAGYLARLNRAIQLSWVQVLGLHDANPWPGIARWTVPLRQMKAYFVHKAWRSPGRRVRWQGACGHFEGRASVSRS